MKKNKIIFWLTTGFLFLFEGIMPLMGLVFIPESALGSIPSLGYPHYFGYSLIVFKVLGAIILIVPGIPAKIKEWAYIGMGFEFIFASISHFVVDGVQFVSFFPLIIMAILIVSYKYYHKLNNKVEPKLKHVTKIP